MTDTTSAPSSGQIRYYNQFDALDRVKEIKEHNCIQTE